MLLLHSNLLFALHAFRYGTVIQYFKVLLEAMNLGKITHTITITGKSHTKSSSNVGFVYTHQTWVNIGGQCFICSNSPVMSGGLLVKLDICPKLSEWVFSKPGCRGCGFNNNLNKVIFIFGYSQKKEFTIKLVVLWYAGSISHSWIVQSFNIFCHIILTHYSFACLPFAWHWIMSNGKHWMLYFLHWSSIFKKRDYSIYMENK